MTLSKNDAKFQNSKYRHEFSFSYQSQKFYMSMPPRRCSAIDPREDNLLQNLLARDGYWQAWNMIFACACIIPASIKYHHLFFYVQNLPLLIKATTDASPRLPDKHRHYPENGKWITSASMVTAVVRPELCLWESASICLSQLSTKYFKMCNLYYSFRLWISTLKLPIMPNREGSLSHFIARQVGAGFELEWQAGNVCITVNAN